MQRFYCLVIQAVAQELDLASTILRQKRRAPTHQERTEAYRRQDGRCGRCSGELDGDNEEFDHLVPVRDAVANQPVLWRALCTNLSCSHPSLAPRPGRAVPSLTVLQSGPGLLREWGPLRLRRRRPAGAREQK